MPTGRLNNWPLHVRVVTKLPVKTKPSGKILSLPTRQKPRRLQKPKNVHDYTHSGSRRISIPTEQTEENVDKNLKKHKAAVDAGKNPTLSWNRQGACGSVQPPLLHIREKISPKSMLDSLRKSRSQKHLFDNFNGFEPGTKYRYYDHSVKGNWQNRIIRGDSARVMAALTNEIEGEVQTIFFDPPYGINFDSNFTLSVGKPEILETLKQDMKIPKDPISVKTFCDTWDRGLDSYLDAMFRRLLLMHSLLKPSGNIFVQIGSKNLHRMSLLLDEIFGAENRISTITFAKSSGTSSSFIPEGSDYLLWYAKDRQQSLKKYTQLYESLDNKALLSHLSSYAMVEEPNGKCRNLTADERNNISKLPDDLRLFQRVSLTSQGISKTGRSEPYVWKGKSYPCDAGGHWTISKQGLDRLASIDRLVATNDGSLRWKKYVTEIPGKRINNQWHTQMQSKQKRYTIQTSEDVLERCILMTTEPGDLVLDPTGGSGVTASVCEKWARRWIVIDSSPVSVATMRHYMCARLFDWYILQDSSDGASKEQSLGGNSFNSPYSNDPSKGFVCDRTPYVSAKILGYGEKVPPVILVDKPFIDKSIKRVSGPFTVESETSSYIVSSANESMFDDLMYSNFIKNVVYHMSTDGIMSIDNSLHLLVSNLEPAHSKSDFTHVGIRDSTNEHVAILIAPDIAPVDNRLIRKAAISAKKNNFDTLIVAAFEFQPLIPDKFVDKINVIKVSINRALQQPELDNSKVDRALVLVGDPRIAVTKHEEKWAVEIAGYDMFDPISGNIVSGDTENVECWMLDTDYDGESFFGREIHFPAPHSSWSSALMSHIKQALGKDLDTTRWDAFESLKSHPFISSTGNIAVKIVTRTGDEMLLRGSLDSLLAQTQKLPPNTS